MADAYKYDSAIFYFTKASETYLTERDTAAHYLALYKASFQMAQWGQVEASKEMALEHIAESKKHMKGVDLATAYRITAHNINLAKGNSDQMFAFYDSALVLLSETEDFESVRLKSIINSDMGVYQYFQSDFARAEFYFKKAVSEMSTLDMERVARSVIEQTNNVGAILRIRGAYNEAIELYQKSGEIAMKYMKEPNGVLGFVYDGIAGAIQASATASNSKAIEYYEKAISLFKEQGESHDPVYSLMNVAFLYSGLNENEKALKYYLEAVELSERFLGPNNIKTADAYSRLGKHYAGLGELELGKKYLTASLKSFEAAQQLTNRLTANYLGLSMINFEQGNREEALSNIQEGIMINEMLSFNRSQQSSYLHSVSIQFHVMGMSDSALTYIEKSLEYGKMSIPESPISTFKANTLKAELLLEKSKATGEEMYLHSALKAIEASKEDIVNIRGWSEHLTDRLNNQYMISQWNTIGFEVAFRLYEKTNDEKFLNQAWFHAESNKAHLALSNLQQSVALELSGVPSNLTRVKEDISNGIAHYELQFQRAEATKDSVGIQRYGETLFDFRKKDDSLKSLIERGYPEYYQLRYKQEYESVAATQDKLHEAELLLNYHVGVDQIYVFQVAKNQIDLKPLNTDSAFQVKVNAYLSQLSMNEENRLTAQEFNSLGSEIRNVLLPTAELLQTYQKLTIIPDSYLSGLSYETLPLLVKGEIAGFSEIDYLIKHFDIHYANSATLKSKLSSNSTSLKPRILAFAPTFGDNTNTYDSVRGGLQELAWINQEVSSLSDHFTTEAFYGEKATERQFRELAGQYSIIHVASHGLINEQSPLYSQLVFAPFETDSIIDGFLHTQELFNMSLQADLVVLSACNSGSGAFASGEGILSLANGFFYAGSKSLVMSLWLANDQSTAQIVDTFYEGLAQGQLKGEALRKAKLNYLNEADNIRSHPYYWAHLVVNGNNQPIKADTSQNIFYLLIVMTGIIITMIAVRRKTAKK